MYHLKPFTAGFTPVTLQANRFLIAPPHQTEVQPVLERFFAAPHEHQLLDEPEENRGVYLLQGAEQQWVLKFNRLTGWKKQLTNFFGLKKSYGLHDLANELINLQAVATAGDLVPSVGAYGYRTRRGCFLRDEYLLVRYFAGHCDVDHRLKQAPEQAQRLLEQIFALFSRMLEHGFCHLDPHPKNILIAPDGEMRLIDFECCAHRVFNPDFTLGFLHGYFYTYWFRRFIDKESYHAISNAYLLRAHPELNREEFTPVYLQFRDHKVSRRTRYSILTSNTAQHAFLQRLVRS